MDLSWHNGVDVGLTFYVVSCVCMMYVHAIGNNWSVEPMDVNVQRWYRTFTYTLNWLKSVAVII
jgi:hypothetical protein